jgi:hypothetical protein
LVTPSLYINFHRIVCTVHPDSPGCAPGA